MESGSVFEVEEGSSGDLIHVLFEGTDNVKDNSEIVKL